MLRLLICFRLEHILIGWYYQFMHDQSRLAILSNRKLLQIAATARPAFLLLTPCCLLLAVAYALAQGISFSGLHLALIFIGGVAAHISVNMFNEYEDFVSGLDLQTRRTAFSGGSGALPMAPELAELVRIGAFIALAATVLIGFYFLWLRGLGLLPLGLLGVVCIYFYTNTITRRPMLCLIAPGLAFGPLMVNGAFFVLSGEYQPAVAAASLIVFFLVNNLLLLNQFPDQEADQSVGRRHLPIFIGKKYSARVYVGFLAAAYLILVVNIALGYLPLYSILGLLTLFLAIPAAAIAVLYYDDIEKLKTAMALNVAVTLTTPLLVALGIFWHLHVPA